MGMPKILLVDDVALFLEIQKKYLNLSAVTILTAKNGEEALEIVGRERPDLVILDVNMPKMDGMTCCTRIKQNPATRAIPVIMVSNVYRQEDIDLCWNAGCDDFMQKPVEGRLFLEKARKFLPAIERREIRLPCQILVRCTVDSEQFVATSGDISLHGIYLVSPAKVEREREVSLSFTLPGSGSTTTARGRVAWLNEGRDRLTSSLPTGFGVQFMEITGEGMALLRTNELKSFLERSRACST